MSDRGEGRDEQEHDGGSSDESGPPGAGEDELEEIEEERKRRLAPENRPENTEIDNTGDNAPDLSRVDPAVDDDETGGDGDSDEDDSDEDDSDAVSAGSGPPGASEDELEEIEEERKRRLAPENRPENTEVDNTGDNAPDLSRVDPAVDEGE